METPTSSSYMYTISSLPTTVVSTTPRTSIPSIMGSMTVKPTSMSRPVEASTPPPIVHVTGPADDKILPFPLEALIGGIAGVILFILFLIVGLCAIWRCSHSKVQHKKAVMNRYETARQLDERTSDNVHILAYSANSGDLPHSNGNPLSATHSIALASLIDNPVYNHTDEAAGRLYEAIPGEQLIPPVVDSQPNLVPPSTTSTQSTTVDDNGEELMDMYEVIVPPETTTGVSTVGAPLYASVPEVQEELAVQAELSITEKDAEAAQNMELYIDMMTPKVPLISSDLEQYMSKRSTLSGGVYTENINPADFTRDDSQELDEGDTQFYAPIYPALKVLPEGFQQPIEVSSDNIKEMKGLGVGQFGEVVLAVTSDLSLKDMRLSKVDENRDISIYVAVKKLKPQLPQIEQEDFHTETKFMSCLKHPNVVRLLGVCYYDPAFIMMECMEEGDLNQFLQRHSEIVPIVTPSSNTQITSSTLIYMASQIASAMEYLADFNFIHRDLATRNCYVGRNTTVKIADLGVNMNLYKTHYYRIRDNTLLPIRWLATECFSGKFSEKSDVWAFGVTMWELFTLAKDRPHTALSDQEVIQNAFKGEYCQFPSKPEACPRPVYVIMERCWVVDMTQRPPFQELHKLLQMCL